MKTCILTGLMAGFFWSATAQTAARVTTARTTGNQPTLQEAQPETVGMSATRLQRMDAVIDDYITSQKQAGVAVL